MKVKMGEYKQAFGDKVTGYVWSECYDCIVFGFCIMSRGVWVIIDHTEMNPRQLFRKIKRGFKYKI